MVRVASAKRTDKCKSYTTIRKAIESQYVQYVYANVHYIIVCWYGSCGGCCTIRWLCSAIYLINYIRVEVL